MKPDRVSQLQQNLTNIARAVSHAQPAARTAALAARLKGSRSWGNGARGFPAERTAVRTEREAFQPSEGCMTGARGFPAERRLCERSARLSSRARAGRGARASSRATAVRTEREAFQP